ncbi:MAG: DinB family protein [Cyclobacteriaceae bacterium]
MKKSIVLILGLLIATLELTVAQTLTDTDRKSAVDQLKQSRKALLKTVKGLSDEQLNYKPADSVWSVAECLEHITVSEQNLLGLVKATIADENDLQSEVEDTQVDAIITNRDRRVKTRPELVPTNRFGSYDATLAAYNEARTSTIDFIKATNDDLRGSVTTFPFGNLDAYQVVVFINGHGKRHHMQIEELMASAGFPK